MADNAIPAIMIEAPDDDLGDTLSSPALSPTVSPAQSPVSSPVHRPCASAPQSPKSPLKSALKTSSSTPRFTVSSPRIATRLLVGDDGEAMMMMGHQRRKGSAVRIGPRYQIKLERNEEEEEEADDEEEEEGMLRIPDAVRNRRKSLADHLKEAGEKHKPTVNPQFDPRCYNQMFIELDELKLNHTASYEWHQKARWIKYEQNIQAGSQRWSKPHVAAMNFTSLTHLKTLLETGLVVLDAEVDTMEELSDLLANDLMEEGMIDQHHMQNIRDTLLLPHRHQHVSQIGRRGSIFPQSARTSPMIRSRNGTPYNGSPSNGSPHNGNKLKDLNGEHVKKNCSNGSTVMDVKDTPQVKLLSPHDAEDPDTWGRHLAEKRRLSGQPDITKRLAEEAESFAVMVGEVPYLTRPMCAFVRLDESRDLDGLMEVPVPVRFVFLLLGPRTSKYNYYQIGRSMATAMSTLDFQQVAFEAMSRKRILRGIDAFLEDALVLPPGDWNENTLLPLLQVAKEKAGEVRRKSAHPLAMHSVLRQLSVDRHSHGDPLQRTGRWFGGLINDVKRRYPLYLSDLKDGLNVQCIATFFFIYFACLAPAITFGGLMSNKTDRWIGVPEMLLATSVVGILFALISAQPLKIIGVTGPMLLFEESLYQICEAVDVEYISTRVWVGMWIAVISVIMVAVDGSVLVRMISRFTEEIFSALISLLFIYETFFKLYMIFFNHPLQQYYPPPPYSYTDDTAANITEENSTLKIAFPPLSPLLNITTPPMEVNLTSQPNTALLSVMLTLGTFAIAYSLKLFRNGKHLGRTVRRALGDFGIPLAIVTMVLLDFLIKDTYTEKLDVPDGLEPTASYKRGWVINPMGMETRLPVWAVFAALIPAILGFILIFMESQICGVIVNKPDRNLQKGSGFHLDMLVIGLSCLLNGFFGFPMMCAAAVRSISHVNALSVWSRTHAPGEKPQLLHVREQRVTALCVHVMISVSVLLGPVLRLVPLSVLFGVFLYMGVASMSGVQFFDRLEMVFMPVKHHSDEHYVKVTKTWKMHLFTGIQLLCLGILWAVKSTKAALAFPFVLILMVPVRKFILPLIFTAKELAALDSSGSQMPKTEDDKNEEEDLDMYEEANSANVRQR